MSRGVIGVWWAWSILPLVARAEGFAPRQETLPVMAPPGAVVVVGEGMEPRLVAMDGGPIDWPAHDGEIVVRASAEHANHVHSTDTFQDADIHAEFVVDPRGG